MLHGKRLTIMNCGDSLALIVRKNYELVLLNNLHTTKLPRERAMLESKSAVILDTNNFPRLMGELMISRSFGDLRYKSYITAEPEIETYELSPEKDKYLLIGTDGFFEVLILL